MKLKTPSFKSITHLSKKALLITGSVVLILGATATAAIITNHQSTGADPVPPIVIQVDKNTTDISDLQTKTNGIQTQVDNKQDRTYSQPGGQGSVGTTQPAGSTNTPSQPSAPSNPSTPPSTPAAPKTPFTKQLTLSAGTVTQLSPGQSLFAFNGSHQQIIWAYPNNDTYATQAPTNHALGFICAIDSGNKEDSTITRQTLVYTAPHASQSIAKVPSSVNTSNICLYMLANYQSAWVPAGSQVYDYSQVAQSAGQTVYINSEYAGNYALRSATIANPYL